MLGATLVFHGIAQQRVNPRLIALATGDREIPYIEEVRTRLASRLTLIPWTPEEPVGAERLGKLATSGPTPSVPAGLEQTGVPV